MEHTNQHKQYVEVIARFTPEGEIKTLYLVWEDGHKYEIDKILDIRRAPSYKAGGGGMRYTVRIYGQERFIFLDRTRWYMEK